MAYTVILTALARRELKELKAFDERRIAEAMRQQLANSPTAETRNRKILDDATASFEFVPPLWQLRVGEYRVFYDVNEDEKTVVVRSVRRKLPHKTTEDVTHD